VPLRSAISTTVPPIPAIPPIPPPRRPDTDVTDPDVRPAAPDLEAATVSRVPVEVGEYDSETNVSVDMPAVDGGAAGIDQPTILGTAVAVAAPPPPRTTTPHGRSPAGGQAGGSTPKLPISTAPESLPPPKDHKQALGPSPACPQCESPMAWVEEHLRFYCKSCRMYF
jgi:hypothetical protein